MPTNLELKAKLRSLGAGKAAARRLGAKRTAILEQIDTYFNVREGRLKLREINRRQVELIYYHRDNVQGSRYSNFEIVPFPEPRTIKKICRTLFGEKVVVRKRRILYLVQNARIHLDQVKGLGTFVEFEVLVTKGSQQAQKLMRQLWKEFGIEQTAVIAGSYSDLLLSKVK